MTIIEMLSRRSLTLNTEFDRAKKQSDFIQMYARLVIVIFLWTLLYKAANHNGGWWPNYLNMSITGAIVLIFGATHLISLWRLTWWIMFHAFLDLIRFKLPSDITPGKTFQIEKGVNDHAYLVWLAGMLASMTSVNIVGTVSITSAIAAARAVDVLVASL